MTKKCIIDFDGNTELDIMYKQKQEDEIVIYWKCNNCSIIKLYTDNSFYNHCICRKCAIKQYGRLL